MMNSELQSKKCNSINAKVAELNVISSETESDTSQSTMVCCLLSKMKNELHNFNIDTSSILCLISIHSTYLIINKKKISPFIIYGNLQGCAVLSISVNCNLKIW